MVGHHHQPNATTLNDLDQAPASLEDLHIYGNYMCTDNHRQPTNNNNNNAFSIDGRMSKRAKIRNRELNIKNWPSIVYEKSADIPVSHRNFLPSAFNKDEKKI